MEAALTKRERKEYTLHTTAIRSAVGEFKHVVKPHLIAIWEKKLYREHGSFEQFCDDLGIHRATAYDWIGQAKVSTAVGAEVSQRTARELAQLPAEQQAAALAAAGESPTSDKVRQARELLEQMSAAEKAQVIGQAETEGRRLAKRVGARDCAKTIERLLDRARKVFDRAYGPDATDDQVARWKAGLDQALGVVAECAEAA